ncbi:hypothetical protein QA601_01245 [Chitinispirillales bacterium ANBcel5]|uniref:hypothetical protein n=1 Tax=Cellulosispirillum alkaliphilum TaxID=3039283 RepID=UPI002A4F1D3A|nr:hypothetical protein [Chitinispirillales bacterium ANBcel5]
MKGLKTVLNKEFKAFAGSDKGVFVVYSVLVLAWSFLFASGDDSMVGGAFWLVFFSVIVAANFSNTVFISERMSGSLEILITSGLSRGAVLFGKMLFIMVMTLLIGGACALIASLWGALLSGYGGRVQFGVFEILLYTGATFLNAAGSAYFSVRLSSPRLLHFINLFILGVIITVYTVIAELFVVSDWVLLALVIVPGVLFSFLAHREFSGERIIQPVIF